MKNLLKKIFSGNNSVHDKNNAYRVLFATDIHGSNVCFKKLLNTLTHSQLKPDAIIIGGDITGKDLIYIIKDSNNGTYYSTERGVTIKLKSKEEADLHEKKAADSGSYIHWCNHDEYLELSIEKSKQSNLLKGLIHKRVREWVELAESRLNDTNCTFIMNTGNDDFFSIDSIIEDSSKVIFPEGKSVLLPNGLTVISCGYANKTPFNCPRDISEENLFSKIDTYIQEFVANGGNPKECLLNLHCPPANSKLDVGPKLDKHKRPQVSALGKETENVGSTAVRNIIEKYSPLLGLHGHIHESPAIDKISDTVVLNPGSEYQSGILKFAIVEFAGKDLKKYYLRTAI